MKKLHVVGVETHRGSGFNRLFITAVTYYMGKVTEHKRTVVGAIMLTKLHS